MTTRPQPADAADQRARETLEAALVAWNFNPNNPAYHLYVYGELRHALADAYRTIEGLRKQLENRG